jgi:glutaredoxin
MDGPAPEAAMLFTGSGCADCERVKELSRAGMSFTSRNVDEDERACEALRARGFRLPVTVIGGRAVAGFDPAALADAIEELRRS